MCVCVICMCVFLLNMYVCLCIQYVYIYIYICVCVCVFVCIVSEIVVLKSPFATQNYLGCYSKLNLDSKFHAEIATHLPINNTVHLEHFIIIVATQ